MFKLKDYNGAYVGAKTVKDYKYLNSFDVFAFTW